MLCLLGMLGTVCVLALPETQDRSLHASTA